MARKTNSQLINELLSVHGDLIEPQISMLLLEKYDRVCFGSTVSRELRYMAERGEVVGIPRKNIDGTNKQYKGWYSTKNWKQLDLLNQEASELARGL